MPPTNDNFANAINLTPAPGVTSFYGAYNNIGATAEVGEPTNNGKTVWWKWTAPTSDQYMVGTRHVPSGASPATDFDTVLDVWTGTALNNLVLVARNDTYAGWEKGSEVQIATTVGTTYYFRVDGKNGAEGHISLYWRLKQRLQLLGCSKCPPILSPGYECMGQITPLITGNNTPSFGSMPKGAYLLKYCGGAWNYRDGWVVRRVPAGADQSWSTNTPGYFLDVLWNNGASVAQFPDAQPAGTGFGSQRDAEASVRCTELTLHQTLVGSISLHFSDEAYTDNIAGTPNPTYALYRLTPKFVFGAFSSVSRVGDVGTTRYNAAFSILNTVNGAFDNVQITLKATGGVSSPTGPVTLSFAPNQSLMASFQCDLLPLGNTQALVTLGLSSPDYGTLPDITIDLTPVLVMTVNHVSKTHCSGVVWQVSFDLTNIGYGPTYDLKATVMPSGGVTNLMDQNTCVPLSPATFDIGEVIAGTGVYPQVVIVDFLPSPVGVTSVTFTVQLQDVSMTDPSAVITAAVPL